MTTRAHEIPAGRHRDTRLRGHRIGGAIVWIAVAWAAAARGEPAPADAAFFTDRVLPILRERCFGCHAHDTETSGGLALDVRSGWERGGRSGPAVVPGKPAESLLVAAVRRVPPDRAMPPDESLPDEEVATLVEWVTRGAPDPRTTTAADAWEDLYAERLRWWSLAPVARPAPPAVRDGAWPRTDIDRFVLAALLARGLAPAPEADRRTWLRRVT
ncbi:MAG TPA: hypothetical protein DC048_04625, partial [Planctomycetaceae bacterium]|nr:hypothetical protein [Planctomycetaceae bacterium]